MLPLNTVGNSLVGSSMGLVLSFIIVATDIGGLSGLLRGDG